ncbi:DUF397 domain-containing protein [Saccharopolyspora pogona]|uniref:DUF397 domain-containing protein n=1 Tax=Saccharopolyspora pogona TaxID=333966 RepID=UPI001682BAA7|nr:DUF397 domain-containing protein [Saccharopolyspora pogona]
MSTFANTSWAKSSYSSNSHYCVEVAITLDSVGVRDTKDRDGGTLLFGPRQWAAFVASIKK